jgi:P-type conjugative transfer protein TrbG
MRFRAAGRVGVSLASMFVVAVVLVGGSGGAAGAAEGPPAVGDGGGAAVAAVAPGQGEAATASARDVADGQAAGPGGADRVASAAETGETDPATADGAATTAGSRESVAGTTAAGARDGMVAGPAAGPAVFPPDAEELAREYRRSGQAAAVERDRAALVPYGHGHPVLRCAPLRACAVELEPGELVLSTASGDSERWLVQVAATGPGGKTALVVVKPTACDLSTNLLVATDRRLYEVGLEAPPCHEADAGRAGGYNPRLPYTGITRFYYPDELVRRWAGEEEAARRAAAERASGAVAVGAPLAALNFSYRWERDSRFPWAPAQVFDDGRHTYIVLPPGARSAEAPALFGVQPGGRLALLNYRVENGTYIADRVLDHAVLAVAAGRGKGPYRLDIVNQSQQSRQGRGGR